ncbi:hypothetical protein VP468E531_P0059 [Vibrio phage 468E53-1]|nr:hypothetical protein VP468E531_P0059 [Vibrio phage 468E53-1]CAH9016031.1 hypothetical protein VP177E371_P0058 [Vibrio phage 177E37-1]
MSSGYSPCFYADTRQPDTYSSLSYYTETHPYYFSCIVPIISIRTAIP